MEVVKVAPGTPDAEVPAELRIHLSDLARRRGGELRGMLQRSEVELWSDMDPSGARYFVASAELVRLADA